MYDAYDCEDYEGEEDEFSPVDSSEEGAPPLPEMSIDISQDALRHELRIRLREAMPAATVRSMAADAIKKILDEEMDAWLRKTIGKTVTGAVEEYFTKERTVTNGWGEPTGSGTEALGDAVVKKAEAFLQQSTSHRGTPLQEMVKEILLNPVESHVKKLLGEIRQEKEAQVTSMVSKLLGESLKKIGRGA